MTEVRVGIVGIGNMGSAHLNCIYSGKIENMRVVAICENSAEKLEDLKEKYPDISHYSDFEKMLEDPNVDGVIIAVPHPFHAEMSIKALEMGKNVLVEKPVDISVTKAKQLNEVAEKSKKTFAIMFNQRTNGLFQKARKIVKTGELGELKRSVWIITNWYRTQSYYNSGGWRATWSGEGGGVLLNQAPHNLDIWQWICGMPKTVMAICNVGKFHNVEVEDDATLYTTYENGATGIFITTTGEYPGTNRLEISGSKGKIILEDGVLKHWKLKSDSDDVSKESDRSFCSIEYDYNEYTAEKEKAHAGILQNFTNAILKGEELLSPGVEGINELTISNAAYLSQWKGNIPVEIPFNGEEFDMLLEAKKQNNKSNGGKTQSEFSKEYNTRWNVRW